MVEIDHSGMGHRRPPGTPISHPLGEDCSYCDRWTFELTPIRPGAMEEAVRLAMTEADQALHQTTTGLEHPAVIFLRRLRREGFEVRTFHVEYLDGEPAAPSAPQGRVGEGAAKPWLGPGTKEWLRRFEDPEGRPWTR